MTTTFQFVDDVVESTVSLEADGRVTVVDEMCLSKREMAAPGDVYASVEAWVADKARLTHHRSFYWVSYYPSDATRRSSVVWTGFREKNYLEMRRGDDVYFYIKQQSRQRKWPSITAWLADVMSATPVDLTQFKEEFRTNSRTPRLATEAPVRRSARLAAKAARIAAKSN